jgi:hypothetical protein
VRERARCRADDGAADRSRNEGQTA